jgi:glycosyltransferase involved in cell wall biosynthesis
VVTLHDVFPLSSDSYSTREFRTRFSALIADAVARADRIICVSSYTRAQLGAVLAVSPERCDVIPHGVDRPVPPSIRMRRQARELAGGEPFFLSVGAVQVRKNTIAAAQAVAQVAGSRAARLLIAGSAGHGAEAVFNFVRQHRLEDRIRVLGVVGEDLLSALYTEATALLFPSLEEGFGLPVLEAMARGLPVIASNTSAIPEVAGDAAILVDPLDTGGMAQNALRLLDDEGWRLEWAERGRARAAAFTWPRTAQLTLETYRKLL